MAGLFDDLIPAPAGASPAVANPATAAGLFDDLVPQGAPPLTIQGAAQPPTAASTPDSFDPEGTGQANYDTPADPTATPMQRLKTLPAATVAGLDGFANSVPFTDRIAAGAASATGLGGTFGDYSGNLAQLHSEEGSAMAAHPAAATAGMLAGGAALNPAGRCRR